MPTLALASTGDVGNIIETFPVRRFPNAAGHDWVIDETPCDGDEMIVDARTIVNERRAMEPALSHFLPLIEAGELKGVQGIPLETGADHRAEERYTSSSSPPSRCPLRKKTTALSAVSQRGRWSLTSAKNYYLSIRILPPTWPGCR